MIKFKRIKKWGKSCYQWKGWTVTPYPQNNGSNAWHAKHTNGNSEWFDTMAEAREHFTAVVANA